MGGDHLVPELLGHDLDGADDAHARHYAELKADGTAVRRGRDVPSAGFRDSGLVVVLASSASAEDLADLRAVIDADDAIDAAVNADDVGAFKPDTAGLRGRAGQGRARPFSSCSRWATASGTFAPARAAGMGCVTVDSGGSSRHELAEAGALAVYRDVEELGRQLMTSPIGVLARHVHA